MYAEEESPIIEQIEAMKICTCCGMEKPLSEFRILVTKNQSWRRHSWCRSCGNLADQARRDRAFKQKPSMVRAKNRAKALSYRERHRERYNAYQRKYQQLMKRRAFERLLGGKGAGE